ncbi:hypothetical protein AMECASPLE_039672 [Ameca splendens]|uniref:Uncharacterized protein n=1 Tax=Ameca splendens TaxID=208324 RepID=A0ABV1A4B0_9TELE
MSHTVRERIHGTQKHPHVTRIPTNTDNEINNEMIIFFHLPKVLVNHASSPPPIPEYSCISLLNVHKPSKARVTEPPGAVLFGIKVQHMSPNIVHTPPFSANNMSRASLFCTAIREVVANCSANPSTASRVRFANLKTL